MVQLKVKTMLRTSETGVVVGAPDHNFPLQISILFSCGAVFSHFRNLSRTPEVNAKLAQTSAY